MYAILQRMTQTRSSPPFLFANVTHVRVLFLPPPSERQRRIQILTGEGNAVDWCGLKCSLFWYKAFTESPGQLVMQLTKKTQPRALNAHKTKARKAAGCIKGGGPQNISSPTVQPGGNSYERE